jgi:hypothetical protein
MYRLSHTRPTGGMFLHRGSHLHPTKSLDMIWSLNRQLYWSSRRIYRVYSWNPTTITIWLYDLCVASELILDQYQERRPPDPLYRIESMESMELLAVMPNRCCFAIWEVRVYRILYEGTRRLPTTTDVPYSCGDIQMGYYDGVPSTSIGTVVSILLSSILFCGF